MKRSFFIGCILFTAMIPGNAGGQSGLTIGSGAYLLVGDSLQIVLHDIDLSNNGNIITTAASRFVFAGSGSVNAVNGTGSTSFGDMAMQRSAGRIQLNTPIAVKGKLIFVSGNIDLNGNSISLADDPNGQLINENDNSRITGNSGFVRKTAFLTAPANSNPGNLGLSFTTLQHPGNTVIERFHYSVNGQSIKRVYHITPDNNQALNATLRIQYLDAELNGLDENQLTAHTNNTGTAWTAQGGTNNSTANLFTISGLATLNWVTLAYANAALPVQLSAFEISCMADQNRLHWQTTQELNSDYFIVERSAGGLIWSTIGKLAAKGFSNTPVDYYFSAAAGSNDYFRLQAVDKDGKFTYSPVKAAACAVIKQNISLYPNPAHSYSELQLSNTGSEPVSLALLGSNGQLLWQKQLLPQNDGLQLRIPMQWLAPGNYYLHIKGKKQQVLKLVKL